MNIQLIQGRFNPEDAIGIITQMIHVKIKYHENKISRDSNEEDVKFRENKIKRLQKDLYDIKQHIESKGTQVAIDSKIEIN
jgi:hypothetical protein